MVMKLTNDAKEDCLENPSILPLQPPYHLNLP